jgi:hypothetical protein
MSEICTTNKWGSSNNIKRFEDIADIYTTERAMMCLLSGVSVGCVKHILAPDAHYCICILQRYPRFFYMPLGNDPFQSATSDKESSSDFATYTQDSARSNLKHRNIWTGIRTQDSSFKESKDSSYFTSRAHTHTATVTGLVDAWTKTKLN